MDLVPPKDWFDLLSRLRLAVGTGPSILAIDEFPWAEETNRGLDGLIQSLSGLDLGRRPLLLVQIGSDQAMTQRLFEHDRPLFGRVDTNLIVDPFNPAETAQALRGTRDAIEVFDTQLVTGGFPELVLHARRFRSVRAVIEDALPAPTRSSPTSPRSTSPASWRRAQTPASSSGRSHQPRSA